MKHNQSQSEEEIAEPVVGWRWLTAAIDEQQNTGRISLVYDGREFEQEWEWQRQGQVRWSHQDDPSAKLSGILIITVALIDLKPIGACFTAVEIDGNFIKPGEFEKIVKDYLTYKNHYKGWEEVARRQYRAMPKDYLKEIAVILDTPIRELPDFEYGQVVPNWVVQKKTFKDTAAAWAGLLARRYQKQQKGK